MPKESSCTYTRAHIPSRRFAVLVVVEVVIVVVVVVVMVVRGDRSKAARDWGGARPLVVDEGARVSGVFNAGRVLRFPAACGASRRE